MEFSRQKYWSGQPFTSPEDLPDPGIKSASPALQADFFFFFFNHLSHQRRPTYPLCGYNSTRQRKTFPKKSPRNLLKQDHSLSENCKESTTSPNYTSLCSSDCIIRLFRAILGMVYYYLTERYLFGPFICPG